MVLLGVETEDDLYDYADKCFYGKIPYSITREPDIGDEMTSVAISPSVDPKEIGLHI